MSKNVNSLQPVAKLAKQNERSAARLHGSVLNELRKQQEQLKELINYRDQYLSSFNDAGKMGLSAIRLQEYRVFLQRLDDAINQQQQNVSEIQQNTENSKKTWLDKRNKSKMINKVVDNRQKLEQQNQEKAEQREIEDRPQVHRLLK